MGIQFAKAGFGGGGKQKGGGSKQQQQNPTQQASLEPALRLSDIRDGQIWLSDLPHERDIPLLKSKGITHVLNVTHLPESTSEISVFSNQFKYLNIHITDHGHVAIKDHFPEAHKFLDEAIDGSPQGAVLVHCEAGVSRSATIVISYFMYKYEMTLPEAYKSVLAKRPVIRPNFGFMKQLCDYELELYNGNGSGFLADYIMEVFTDLPSRGITKGDVVQALKDYENWMDAIDFLLRPESSKNNNSTNSSTSGIGQDNSTSNEETNNNSSSSDGHDNSTSNEGTNNNSSSGNGSTTADRGNDNSSIIHTWNAAVVPTSN